MLGDESDAEDIAQQVFVRIWRSAPRYEPTAKFTTWLFKITRNLVFNELRRRRRHAAFSLDRTVDEDERPIHMPDHGTKAPTPLFSTKKCKPPSRQRSMSCPKFSGWQLFFGDTTISRTRKSARSLTSPCPR
jgi:RNA polymerase sigma factor (sigma-70 family)